MDWIGQPDAWIALATLTVLEIVLGIDNIVFVSILSEKVREDQRGKARRLGLAMALLTRIGLLFSIVWVMRLTREVLTVGGHGFSGRDLILVLGGVFLIYKSTHEIHEKLEGEIGGRGSAGGTASLASVVIQIGILDLVFSLDSVITAVGMAEDVAVMVAAVVVAVGFMMLAAGSVSAFVARHPTVKMLALSFLLLIGVSLIAEGFGQHVSKAYIYFAMGFSVFVESLNLWAAKRAPEPVHLHSKYPETRAPEAT